MKEIDNVEQQDSKYYSRPPQINLGQPKSNPNSRYKVQFCASQMTG
jgi:hypothetical protein